jgi:hypothetical protein
MSLCARNALCIYEEGHGGACFKWLRNLQPSIAKAPVRVYDVPALQAHVRELREKVVAGCDLPVSDDGETLSLEVGRLHTALSLGGMALHFARRELKVEPLPAMLPPLRRAK